jgi:hypothetical protein
MRYIKWPFLSLIIFIVQIKLSTFFNVPINLLVILVYAYSLKNLPEQPQKNIYPDWAKNIKIVLFGVLIGFFEDILSEDIIGPSLFSKGMVAFLTIRLFTGLFFKWTPLLGAIFLLALTLIDNLVIYGFKTLFSNITISNLFLLKTILLQMALNIPFGIIIKGKSS